MSQIKHILVATAALSLSFSGSLFSNEAPSIKLSNPGQIENINALDLHEIKSGTHHLLRDEIQNPLNLILEMAQRNTSNHDQKKIVDCTTTGTDFIGSRSCTEIIDTGYLQTHEQYFKDSARETLQIRVKHLDHQKNVTNKWSVRLNQSSLDGKVSKELFDIVHNPSLGRATRNFITRHYKNNQLSEVIWSHFKENHDMQVLLEINANLKYRDGIIYSGSADRYQANNGFTNIFHFDPDKNPNLRLSESDLPRWDYWVNYLADSAKDLN